MKRCTLCGESKALDMFNAKRAAKDGRQNVCRDCNRARSRQYYAENREDHVRTVMARARAQRVANLEMVGAYFMSHPCVDCGEADVRVLDFDHREDKLADVMWLVHRGYSAQRIMAEIAKCDVRCRNCHAKITYDRLGKNWRSVLADSVASAN